MINVGGKKFVFPPRKPSMRSESAVSIGVCSEIGRDDKQPCHSPGQGQAAKPWGTRSSRKLINGLPTIANFGFTETVIQNTIRSPRGSFFLLSPQSLLLFLLLICTTLLFRSPRVALRKEGLSLAFKQSAACDACDLVLRNHRPGTNRGGGGYCHIWAIYCRYVPLWRVWFSSSLL